MWNWNQRTASQGSRTSSRGASLASHGSHASMGSTRGSQPRELEFQFFIRQTETLYPAWWTREGVVSWYRDLPDDTPWNCYICGIVLFAVIWQVTALESIYLDIIDIVYNLSYAVHIFAIGYKIVSDLENTDITFWTVISFLVDLGSFAHYGQASRPNFKLACYYLRLHRPYRYLGSLNDYNLKGSILGTTLKFVYIFLIVRITWAWIWMHVHILTSKLFPWEAEHGLEVIEPRGPQESTARQFLSAVYIINKMFIPIGPPVFPDNDVERVVCLLIMISGCLLVTGAAVASLSLIISLYMRPEETFRARYRLIIKEMKDTQVPQALRDKVETFYKMYWHKQRAVSETQLLPTFPPTLPATVYADIYFEATQKARILRELSYQLLSEIAKSMETIHYIPGDAIIKRGSKKSHIIYITYGDVEMLTAEDDNTAILRLTRGTVLTPCGGAIPLALSLSHLAVRAATFCTAHVLSAVDLWKIVYKFSVTQDHAGPILAAFTDHIERVKRHYGMKLPDEATHKSSILHFNRNLMALKEMKNEHGEPLLASSDVFLEIAGCYLMRNRPDMTLTDQSDEICLRPTFPCILQPTSSLLFAWHILVATLILAITFTHPYYLVYKKTVPLEFRFFDYLMTGVYVIDHIVHLSTGANVEEGVPINFAQTSSQQMRSHWFVLDVVATVPMFEFIGDGHFAGINKILRLPKFFKVLKDLEEMCMYRGNILRFLSYTMLLLVACYLIAAMQQGFMCFQSGYCLVTNLTHPPFWEMKPLDEETVEARLIFGLYWAISMINFTIHRETWGKENWSNVIYTLVILEVCIVLRIFMEAVYSATIMVTTALGENYGAKIATVKSFLIRNDIDPTLRKRFITYLELCWYTDKAFKITHKHRSTIFYDLPPHVFQDIVGRNRSKYILCIPFMKLLKKEELRMISSRLKLFYTSPNEILLNTGELTNEMYIIKRGFCEILDPVSKTRVGTLSTKTHFGALVCLLRLPAYNTIRAITHVQIYCIPRKFLAKALETPQIKTALDILKKSPEYKRLQENKMSAFVKYEPPPPTPNTMHFRLPRKHEPDTEFLQPFNRLGFLSILRYIFPRFTIRPDGRYLIRYEWFRVSCALCTAMLFPHYTYLVVQWPNLFYACWFLDLSAWYDIFQRMLVGYYNDDGILVYHPASTAAYYMKGAFLMDLFGCIWLENLEAARMNSVDNRIHVTPTKQFLMLNRLIQLYRMPSAMAVLEDYIERRDVLLVFKAMPIFMTMINILTSLMIFYSVNIYYTKSPDGDIEWFIEPINDQGGSWLNLFSSAFRYNLTESPWNLHLAAYFWVVYESSTTGYGLFNPSNSNLMEILFVGMCCCTMFVTYFSVRIISIRANVNKSLAGFQQHMRDINIYLAKEKLDPELQKEVKRYYEYNWEKMGGIDYKRVLKMCDQITLRTDAILHIYGPTFTKCPLLKTSDISLLRIIGRSVRSVYFLRDMKVMEHDDIVRDMYFVDYGGAELRISTGEMSTIYKLPRGSVFGNLEGTAGQRSPYHVIATSRVHLMIIKAEVFANIMKDFPTVKELMDKYRGPEKKMYILGSEVQPKLRRNVTTTVSTHTKTSLVKYIYFEEGMVQIYLIAVSLGCIYLDLYNAGFQNNSLWMIITLYSLDFCFFLKICMQHSLPLLVTNKSYKRIMKPLRKIYFRREFRYDLVSILPIELFSFATNPRDQWFWFAWLRLNRAFRITTVHKCLKKHSESITVNLTMTTMATVGIWFFLFVHTTTCLWFFIGSYEDQKAPNSSWMHSSPGKAKYGGSSFLCHNLYICSLYFIITTFTQNGVGDIMPQNPTEVVFVSLLMILATMVFMVYVGEFSNIIQYQSYRSFSFYSKYLELQDFMHNNRVSKNLVYIVNKYTLHLWRETRGMQEPHFLKSAPLSLRLRIMSAAYLHHITRHHIFEECEAAFLRQLVGCIQLFTYNEGMYVVKESEITNSMYVIHTGKVKETCEDMDISARVYPAGSYFGIGLLRNTPYTHSYQTMCKSQVLTLNLDDWEYLLKHFPDSKNAIHKHMRQVGDKDMDQSNWPGGAPGPDEPPDYELISDVVTDYPGVGGPYPTPRRRSSDDEAPPLPSSLRRTSQFAWPTDSRNDEERGSVGAVGGRPRMSTLSTVSTGMDGRGVEHATAEDHHKLTFFQKIAMTAKKLMGRESDPELSGISGEGKDELLLEEDEEATEALLAQVEAEKRKSTEKKKKRRKSMFHAMEDEDTEKHMLTLDIDDQNDDEEKSDSPFTMRPLRIRDDEEDEETREVLNLGRLRKPKARKESEVDEEASSAEVTRPSTSRVNKDGSFSRTPIIFDPTALSASSPSAPSPTAPRDSKPFTKPKLVFPGGRTSTDEGDSDVAEDDNEPSGGGPSQKGPRRKSRDEDELMSDTEQDVETGTNQDLDEPDLLAGGFIKPATDIPDFPESETPTPTHSAPLRLSTSESQPILPRTSPASLKDDKNKKKTLDEEDEKEMASIMIPHRDADDDDDEPTISRTKAVSSLLLLESATELTTPSTSTPFTTSGTSDSRSTKTFDTTDQSQYDADFGPAESESGLADKSGVSTASSYREEGTSISNLNRRFVHVRYDEHEDAQNAPPVTDDEDARGLGKQDAHLSMFTMDSDERSVADKSVSDKTDDEDDDPHAGPSKKKKKPSRDK